MRKSPKEIHPENWIEWPIEEQNAFLHGEDVLITLNINDYLFTRKEWDHLKKHVDSLFSSKPKKPKE